MLCVLLHVLNMFVQISKTFLAMPFSCICLAVIHFAWIPSTYISCHTVSSCLLMCLFMLVLVCILTYVWALYVLICMFLLFLLSGYFLGFVNRMLCLVKNTSEPHRWCLYCTVWKTHVHLCFVPFPPVSVSFQSSARSLMVLESALLVFSFLLSTFCLFKEGPDFISSMYCLVLSWLPWLSNIVNLRTWLIRTGW